MQQFREKKARGERITALTAYDYPTARLLDESGIDIILVGDSLGMVVLGYEDTTEVTLAEMVHHTRAAARGVKRAVLTADLPINTYATPGAGCHDRARAHGGRRAIRETRGRGESRSADRGDRGGRDSAHGPHRDAAAKCARGGRLQSERPHASEAEALLRDAHAVEKAGVFAVVLEIVSPEAARQITNALEIPTIGIGSGKHCDGQILVTHDLIGLFPWFTPKFVSPEAHVADEIRKAVQIFIGRTKSGDA